jgi:hypothetical protein
MKLANLRNFIRRIYENSQKRQESRNGETRKWMEKRIEKNLEKKLGENYLERVIPRAFMREASVEELMQRSLAAPFSPDTFHPLCSRASKIF